MLKMIVYIISQKPGKYKTNFIKPSQRKTDILYREFAAKSHFILEMLADLLNSGCKKAHPCLRMSFFAHEAGYRLCGTWITTVKENSRRRRTCARYPKKKEEKDFTLSRACALAVTIL